MRFSCIARGNNKQVNKQKKNETKETKRTEKNMSKRTRQSRVAPSQCSRRASSSHRKASRFRFGNGSQWLSVMTGVW